MKRGAFIGVLACVAFVSAPLMAQLPWNDAPTRVDGDDIVATRLGWPAPRVRSFEAQRRSARDVGEERGRAALHAFVDDALARSLVEPAEASRVHTLVDSSARRGRVRALSDGSAIVEMRVTAEPLSAAVGTELSWSR
ncbi:MAG: hypothetical protein AB8H86_10730 [Polyangiales bacterium]